MKKSILSFVIAAAIAPIATNVSASVLSNAVASQLIAAENIGTSTAINEAVSNFNGLSSSDQYSVIDGLNANGHGAITHQLTPVDTAAAQNASAINTLQNTVYVPVKPAQVAQLTPIANPSKIPTAVLSSVPQKNPAAPSQAVPVTQLIPTPVAQKIPAAPVQAQQTPAVQLIPMPNQQTPQATPVRPQSQPVVQLIPTPVAQKIPAAPVQAQQTPAVQLIPTPNQQTPQATPVRPQSQPVVQLIPTPVAQKIPAAPVQAQQTPAVQLIPTPKQQVPQTTPQITGTTYREAVSAMMVKADPISDTERNRQATEAASAIAEGNTGAIATNRAIAEGNTAEIVKLQSGVEQVKATGAYANARIDAANANIEANREAMAATNKRVSENSAAIADHESRIGALESSTNAKFGQLKDKIEDNRKRASAGIAGVAAMANIPQVIQGQTFSVGAGVGNTDSESALAVGASARASENVVVKASVSNDTQHNFVVGAGVSYGW
ncbi:YadA-like family protein [uncultured Leclercia sp.]|uniref:YadA-like family protein n=1 Tax=uncultured Leclercia sp. TaxID=332959 RepID=UPI002599D001|nr:YadA-like family protein [uncultured Leclercia sp.]